MKPILLPKWDNKIVKMRGYYIIDEMQNPQILWFFIIIYIYPHWNTFREYSVLREAITKDDDDDDDDDDALNTIQSLETPITNDPLKIP